MMNTEALTVIYNGILQGYQHKQYEMIENNLPDNSRRVRSENMRERLTNQIAELSTMAYDIGDHDSAAFFMDTARNLGSDAVPALPL
ncbi:hypothetical protein [Aliivibrio logei]|uniref:Uncharacterized protein n=1 Tax=Aliivibrio logei TaxID=688 RepID=A0A1B9NTM5_ALILO|nr:hypothetical protein [Aliivibrio logei]OCH17016.1 hypothetical protein A6E04_19370 [Aliivibrio logei]